MLLDHLAKLKYEDQPDYDLMLNVFRSAKQRKNIRDSDLYDWETELSSEVEPTNNMILSPRNQTCDNDAKMRHNQHFYSNYLHENQNYQNAYSNNLAPANEVNGNSIEMVSVRERIKLNRCMRSSNMELNSIDNSPSNSHINNNEQLPRQASSNNEVKARRKLNHPSLDRLSKRNQIDDYFSYIGNNNGNNNESSNVSPPVNMDCFSPNNKNAAARTTQHQEAAKLYRTNLNNSNFDSTCSQKVYGPTQTSLSSTNQLSNRINSKQSTGYNSTAGTAKLQIGSSNQLIMMNCQQQQQQQQHSSNRVFESNGNSNLLDQVKLKSYRAAKEDSQGSISMCSESFYKNQNPNQQQQNQLFPHQHHHQQQQQQPSNQLRNQANNLTCSLNQLAQNAISNLNGNQHQNTNNNNNYYSYNSYNNNSFTSNTTPTSTAGIAIASSSVNNFSRSQLSSFSNSNTNSLLFNSNKQQQQQQQPADFTTAIGMTSSSIIYQSPQTDLDLYLQNDSGIQITPSPSQNNNRHHATTISTATATPQLNELKSLKPPKTPARILSRERSMNNNNNINLPSNHSSIATKNQQTANYNNNNSSSNNYINSNNSFHDTISGHSSRRGAVNNSSILDSDAQSLPQGTYAIKAGPQTVMSQWVVSFDDDDYVDDEDLNELNDEAEKVNGNNNNKYSLENNSNNEDKWDDALSTFNQNEFKKPVRHRLDFDDEPKLNGKQQQQSFNHPYCTTITCSLCSHKPRQNKAEADFKRPQSIDRLGSRNAVDSNNNNTRFDSSQQANNNNSTLLSSLLGKPTCQLSRSTSLISSAYDKKQLSAKLLQMSSKPSS